METSWEIKSTQKTNETNQSVSKTSSILGAAVALLSGRLLRQQLAPVVADDHLITIGVELGHFQASSAVIKLVRRKYRNISHFKKLIFNYYYHFHTINWRWPLVDKPGGTC